MLKQPKRNRYYYGKLLLSEDLQDEQAYFLEKHRLLNRFLHGPGVVCGLLVVPTDPASPDAVVLEPGLALDATGREIIVTEHTRLDLGEFSDIEIGPRCPSTSYVTLKYAEVETDPVPQAPGPNPSFEKSRIQDSFKLSVRSEPVPQSDNQDLEVTRKLSAAFREGRHSEDLHLLLSKAISRRCIPPSSENALTLASVTMQDCDPVQPEHIDNHTNRQLVLSSAHSIQLLLQAFNVSC